MNEVKMLEQRLHSWTPRRPSRGLDARIFGRRPLSRRAPTSRWGERAGMALAAVRLPVTRWNWLAPMAVGCVVLAVVSFSERRFSPMMGEHSLSDGIGRWDRESRLFANAALSNREMVAYYTTDRHSAWNHWGIPILGWTNLLAVP